MNNPIKEIYRFNKEAGLLDKPYNDLLEDSMCIEECLEGHPHLDRHPLDIEIEEYTPKLVSRAIISTVHANEPLTEVERLDKACDKAIIAIGSMAKLGLNPQQITKALNIVMQVNFTKLKSAQVDSTGKLLKPSDFEGPELALQSILDERG